MKALLSILFSTTLAMCGSPNAGMQFAEAGDASASFDDISVMKTDYEMSPQESLEQTPEPITKKVVKTGNLTFRSQDLDKDYKMILHIAAQLGGFIDYENQENSDYQKSYELVVRVPAAVYDTLVSQISKNVWHLQNMSSNIEDVTLRYYDLQTRIENQKALEIRYKELLKKANNVSEMLEIERNLNAVQQEIELLTGKFKYLSSQISHSTLRIHGYEVKETDQSNYEMGFWAKIGYALKDGWQGLQSLTVNLVSGWPYFLIIFGGIFWVYKWRRRKK